MEKIKEAISWANEASPVFVVGPERSGTSLLFQQVSNHSSFCDFSQATVETFVFVKPWLLFEKGGPNNFEIREYVKNIGFNMVHEWLEPIKAVNDFHNKLGLTKSYIGKPNRREVWLKRSYKEAIRVFFYASWLSLGKNRLVEKTPAHIRCMNEIFMTFPNAKVLICLRDPAEIVASHRKRLAAEIAMGKAEDDPDLQWLSHSVDAFIKYLTTIDRNTTDALDKHRGRVKIVRYSTLTNEPDSTMSEVFQFLCVGASQVLDKPKKRWDQLWDPLLNRRPQNNHIDVSKYINKKDLAKLKNLRKNLSQNWG